MSKLLFQYPTLISSEQIENSIYDILEHEIDMWFRLLDIDGISIPLKVTPRHHIIRNSHMLAVYYFDYLLETDIDINIIKENGHAKTENVHGIIRVHCEHGYQLEIINCPFFIRTECNDFFINIKDSTYKAYQLRAYILDDEFNTFDIQTTYYTDDYSGAARSRQNNRQDSD